MASSPSLLELEFHGVRCHVILHEEILGERLRVLYEHVLADDPKSPTLVVTITRGSAPPPRPARPTVQLIADEIIWGDLVDGQLVLSDGRSTARVDYAEGHASLELTDRSYAAEYVATHRLFPIALAELLRTRSVYYLHAAAVAGDDGAVLFTGDSEAGKSTLAYCAMRDGMKFIADDGLLFAFSNDDVPYVEAYYRELALDASIMSESDRARCSPSEPMHTGDPRSLLVPDTSRCAKRARVQSVLGLERIQGPSAVLPASRTELFGELLRQNPFAALNPELASGHIHALGRLLASARLGIARSGTDIVQKPGAALSLLQGWAQAGSK